MAVNPVLALPLTVKLAFPPNPSFRLFPPPPRRQSDKESAPLGI